MVENPSRPGASEWRARNDAEPRLDEADTILTAMATTFLAFASGLAVR